MQTVQNLSVVIPSAIPSACLFEMINNNEFELFIIKIQFNNSRQHLNSIYS